MKPATPINLFPCNTREVWLGFLFALALGCVYWYQAYYVNPLGWRGLSLIIVTFFAFVGVNFYAAFLIQNRLIPHLVLIVFWSLIILSDYISPDAYYYKSAGVAFLINVGWIFVLQMAFLTTKRRRMRANETQPFTENTKLFPWNTRELLKGFLFFLILNAVYVFQAFIAPAWKFDLLLSIMLLTLVMTLILYYLALVSQNRLMPYLVMACFWTQTVLLSLLGTQEQSERMIQTATTMFLVSACFIFSLQLRFLFTEKYRSRRDEPEPTLSH
ncbi:hypothetical protein [Gimesia panareensis]|uniref:Uncharacterized protein n=1 Tax=Gimesia panareensis TaxID=2527978 RepID=A0A518A119_9PLAN|nr:hypothetical protein [Gimesia panareensis]QDU48425.1 hypothetical protein Pan110_07390 [Gimesia panareensis]QDV18453.1 hypothetical protein Pan153_31110 [Gimesia panareensis]